MLLKIALIRAGKSEGSRPGRTPSLSDQPLEPKEKERLRQSAGNGLFPPAALIYASPFLRCRETAFALYPRIPAILINHFGQFDGGIFADKSAGELEETPGFHEWSRSDEVSPCPQGGDLYAYGAMCARAFRQAAAEMASKGIEHAAIITHGLTIRLLMQRFCAPRALYRDFDVSYGGGYELCYDSRLTTAYLLRKL